MVEVFVATGDPDLRAHLTQGVQAGAEDASVTEVPSIDDLPEALRGRHHAGGGAIVLADLRDANGSTVLATLKEDADLRRIPVVGFTEDASDKAVLEAYNNHLNACLALPDDEDAITSQAELAVEFYARIARISGAP